MHFICVEEFQMLQRLQTILQSDVLHLSFFGGSVTEGYPYEENIPNPYPELVAQKWMQAYPMRKCYVHNYASCGEKSSRALLISDQLARQNKNHLIFLEYALTDDMSRESVMIYESLVRKLLNRKDKPVVITLLMPSQKEMKIKTFMKEISIHYKIPCLDFSQKLCEKELKTSIESDVFWLDATHPTKEGHDWIAEKIFEWMQKSMWQNNLTKRRYRMPQKRYFSSSYENVRTIMVDKDIIYPYTIDVYGSIVWISYFQHEEAFMGTVQVFIDQTFICNLHGKSFYCWYYPVQRKIFEGNTSSKHSITFQMAPGEEKKRFMLECIGVVE